MDEEEQSRASSPTSDRDNEPDEVMEDADDGDREEEGDFDGENNNEEEGSRRGETENGGDETATVVVMGDDSQAATNPYSLSNSHADVDADTDDRIRPEVYSARLYDIVPTMAAPMSTSINAMAITPDLRYWITGGADGYIRKYDGQGTINGKLALTVAQRHPFVDSVTKAGILMSYWPNEEPAAPGRSDQEHVLSSVYSLAVHSEALWLLSGLESGAINLQSVRHDEGKRISCLQKHTNAVSVLTLAPDERSVLSGAWDKNIFDWDLDTGNVKRSFDGSGGQISSIELRPASGAPIPADADEPLPSSTIATNNGAPMRKASFIGGDDDGSSNGIDKSITVAARGEDEIAVAASPAHESLFGGSDDAGSLFGETAGEQPFGHDDDEFGASMSMGQENDASMNHPDDTTMAGLDSTVTGEEAKPSEPVKSPVGADAMDVDTPPPAPASGPGDTQVSAMSGISEQTELATDTDTIKAEESSQAPQEQEQPLESQSMADISEQVDTKRPQSPMILSSQPPPTQHEASQISRTTFLSSAIDGTIRIWDRRVPNPVARINNRAGVPPWCMSACWSPDGNKIYAGRRNGTVEEFDIGKAKRGWQPERVLRFPAGSGAVSAIKPMVNGRHLVCASHDILRLYDLRETRAFKHSTVPFLIIPGPPRAGVISSLYIDPSSRFMLSAAGTRGWDGTNTEVLIGYEIHVESNA
ncbi:hypothetical protein TRIATDRAFT_293890 [Trichoderma atroviride IMI 206040]|uniref:Transcription factor spt8 beta-propeller domain-containing protein n=1 Tax=Hypocrea atroviridis (strain ATCC 20476 / IMI 206040) TaxID=452589 RepID=G9P2C6_HYPAI|nr:uncharacterized protein TRIATDRAFT_293890 [Trichoderma atroviride IMI 206040]EHK42665.1 hypothetical protein TRIATDRAFT_293890 [Trichoderma atroviride IMI 206040]